MISDILEKIRSQEQHSEIKINLSNYCMGDEGIIVLVEILRQFKEIKRLTLDLSGNYITAKGASIIAQFIQEISPYLLDLEINLGNNIIGCKGLIAFANIIQSESYFRQTWKLNFLRNNLLAEGALALASALKPTEIPHLQLEMSGNNIGVAAERSIQEALAANDYNHISLPFITLQQGWRQKESPFYAIPLDVLNLIFSYLNPRFNPCKQFINNFIMISMASLLEKSTQNKLTIDFFNTREKDINLFSQKMTGADKFKTTEITKLMNKFKMLKTYTVDKDNNEQQLPTSSIDNSVDDFVSRHTMVNPSEQKISFDKMVLQLSRIKDFIFVIQRLSDSHDTRTLQDYADKIEEILQYSIIHTAIFKIQSAIKVLEKHLKEAPQLFKKMMKFFQTRLIEIEKDKEKNSKGDISLSSLLIRETVPGLLTKFTDEIKKFRDKASNEEQEIFDKMISELTSNYSFRNVEIPATFEIGGRTLDLTPITSESGEYLAKLNCEIPIIHFLRQAFSAFSDALTISEPISKNTLTDDEISHLLNFFKNEEIDDSIIDAIRTLNTIKPIYKITNDTLALFIDTRITNMSTYFKLMLSHPDCSIHDSFAAFTTLTTYYNSIPEALNQISASLSKEWGETEDVLTKERIENNQLRLKKCTAFFTHCFQISMRLVLPIRELNKNLTKILEKCNEFDQKNSLTILLHTATDELNSVIRLFKKKMFTMNFYLSIRELLKKINNYTSSDTHSCDALNAIQNYFSENLVLLTREQVHIKAFLQEVNAILNSPEGIFEIEDSQNTKAKMLLLEIQNKIKNDLGSDKFTELYYEIETSILHNNISSSRFQ